MWGDVTPRVELSAKVLVSEYEGVRRVTVWAVGPLTPSLIDMQYLGLVGVYL